VGLFTDRTRLTAVEVTRTRDWQVAKTTIGAEAAEHAEPIYWDFFAISASSALCVAQVLTRGFDRASGTAGHVRGETAVADRSTGRSCMPASERGSPLRWNSRALRGVGQ
jgi:hypothetical protein